jgi:hypothetical protein
MKTGTMHLPLHGGQAPRWLFARMTRLAREMAIVIVREHGPAEMLRRLSDPFWFQSFGCVLGFDWHSSGLTTTVCGALKQGLAGLEGELGLFAAGGKGGTSRQTPHEIMASGEKLSVDPQPLVYASRMSAKVDNSALQDGYQLYHHCFFYSRDGQWSVVQQGMNQANSYARRYHWLGERVSDFVCEPHQAICCDQTQPALNMVARESAQARDVSAEVARAQPVKVLAELKKIVSATLPRRHHVLTSDIQPDRLEKIFLKTYERQAADFEQLLGLEGVGPKTIRALSLIAELVYGASPSYSDPARYSFAHGGKDGHPYPVDRQNYDFSVEYLKNIINRSRVELTEKQRAFRRLAAFRQG